MKQQLPARPSLVQLKHQAKDLLHEYSSGVEDAKVRFREHLPGFSARRKITLSDAQLVLAREYEFASWPRLKRHVESLEAFEERVSRLRAEFAAGDEESRRELLKPAHARERFENYDPEGPALSEADARLLIANQEGYAFWSKYESYLHLEPAVRDAIAVARTGDLEHLRGILRADPKAANPHWVSGFAPPNPIPNDSIPLFCVSEGIFNGTNRRGNGYEIADVLMAAGAEVEIGGGHALTGAVSFNALRVAEALLDRGAAVDGVDGDGVPMAYALHFGFREMAELLARRGARLDLRFASGLGRMEEVRGWFLPDGALKPGAGALADPYGLERKQRGESPFRYERTREKILLQALYFACVQERLEAADFLLAQGAEINGIVPGLDMRGTILHRVASMEWEGPPARCERVIRFLIERGADPAARDREYNATPAGWASYCGRREAAALLAELTGASGPGEAASSRESTA
ncbi:MAG TPA: ankyrin repeat domain-containing protein [Bryobacteraceae bacterium]|jgi:hypothetical protein|nr:ankyrin repeat domain-containing protein [Bryobacteraceae bacterium]